MTPFTTLSGPAAPLPDANIDTDQLCPKQHLSAIRRVGFGLALFSDRRFDETGAARPSFILNQPGYTDAAILIAGPNFGCGSSREHAVWALVDFGIRCVIAPSFGEIFLNNSVNSGLLAVGLPAETVSRLSAEAFRAPGQAWTVNLPEQTVASPSGARAEFEIEAYRKHRLVEGLDEIALTLTYCDALQAYQRRMQAIRPWLWRDRPEPAAWQMPTADDGA